MLRQGQHVLHILHRSIDQMSDIFGSGVATIMLLRFQMVFGPQDLIEFTHHMYGQTYRTRLIHDGALYALTYPPGGVSGKTETALRLELVDGAHQAKVTLFNKIQQGNAAVNVVLGD